jgi:eukaryotic-like serine/threonine-protein kinase
MGEVYLAEDTKLHRRVAIKFLPTDSVANEQANKRLLREAQAAAKLDHPNICAVHEVAEEDGRSFIVMPYVEGENLEVRMKRKPLDLSESLAIAIQVVDALAEAHLHGIIHRDIKPSNIIITPRGQAKVMDFGLAKVVAGTVESEAETMGLLTTPGTILGTVPYMSPEQVRGEKIDGRSDIFSFGVVLYEMISGRQPFAAESAAATASAILTHKPSPLSRLVPEVPEELQRIVSKCLEKDTQRRYQTTRDVATDLDNCRLKSEASIARTTNIERTAVTAPLSNRQQRRLPRRAILLAALLFLVLGATVTYFFVLRSSRSSNSAQIKSLAVLPLKSMNAGEDFLGLGIADAVIRRISQTGQLIVRPTSAVRRYVDEDIDALSAARQLSADAVLEGNVQRAGDRLRVSVNLLRTSDGVSLWTENFDMHTADIFTIQDSISRQVASRLQLKLNSAQEARLGKRYTSNAEAYDYYVKGETSLERRTTAIGDRQPVETAIDYFKKAIDLDSKYSLAHAALGYSYMWMGNFNDPDNPIWIRQAQEELARAEAIDPELAEIHSARFEYYFSKNGGWDLSQAAREARQALALNPGVGHLELGTIYDHLGLNEGAGLKEMQRAIEIDPTNTFNQARLAESYELYGRFDEAIETCRNFFSGPCPALSLIAKHRYDEARQSFQEAVKKNPGDLRAQAGLALMLALDGKFNEAEAAIPGILEQCRNNRSYHHITYDIVCIYALEGKTSEAVKWLRTTAETGMPDYPLFARDELLNRIRKEPAFLQFMTELKTRWDGYRREFTEDVQSAP